MPRYESSVIIRAPRDFVFACYSDPNNLTKLTNAYKAVNGVRKEGEWVVVDADVAALGTKGKAVVKRKFQPNDRIEEIVESDLAVGNQKFTFTDVSEGTKLVLKAEVIPKGALGKILGPLAKGRMRRFSEEQLAIGKRFIEEIGPN